MALSSPADNAVVSPASHSAPRSDGAEPPMTKHNLCAGIPTTTFLPSSSFN